MRKFYPFILIAVFAFGFLTPAAASANDEEISVKAEVNRARITIGDQVEYKVVIRHDPAIKILSQIPAPSKDLFDVKSSEPISEEDGRVQITGRKFVLTTFKLGEFILEPVAIQYKLPGGEVETVETSRLYISVESVAKGEEKGDIRGIKSVVDIAKEYLWLIILVTVVVLLLAGPFLYRWFRRAHEKIQATREYLTPEDEALRDLSELFGSELLSEGNQKMYFFRLSEILRVYLERRFAFQAVESTTFEIDRYLRENDQISNALRNKIKEVLEAADLAKFAKWQPSAAEVNSLNNRSKEIVEEARPAPEPEDEEPQKAEGKVKHGV